jgi:hypothetical protein
VLSNMGMNRVSTKPETARKLVAWSWAIFAVIDCIIVPAILVGIFVSPEGRRGFPSGGGGGAFRPPPPRLSASYLITFTGMKRTPLTTWLAERTSLVTIGLLPGLPRAGPMVIVAVSWSLRG